YSWPRGDAATFEMKGPHTFAPACGPPSAPFRLHGVSPGATERGAFRAGLRCGRPRCSTGRLCAPGVADEAASGRVHGEVECRLGSSKREPNLIEPRVALVTGASSGIGFAAASLLAARGYRTFGTSRKPQDNSGPKSVEMVQLDVRSDESVCCAMD